MHRTHIAAKISPMNKGASIAVRLNVLVRVPNSSYRGRVDIIRSGDRATWEMFHSESHISTSGAARVYIRPHDTKPGGNRVLTLIMISASSGCVFFTATRSEHNDLIMS